MTTNNLNNNGKNFNFKSLPLAYNKQAKAVPDVALFIDNDGTHTENVMKCGPHMYVLKVGGVVGAVPDLPWESPEMVSFQEAVRKGPNGASILDAWRSSQSGDAYDPESGITKENCDTIQKWVKDQKAAGFHSPAVLFDYDRTLTVIEGTQFGEFPTVNREGFVEYYMGGLERLQRLRDLFKFLNENQVQMYILTNNTGCSVEKGSLFEQVGTQIFSPYPVEIICGKQWKYDKRNAAADSLSSVCKRASKQQPLYTDTSNNTTNEYDPIGDMTAEQLNAYMREQGMLGGKRKQKKRGKTLRKRVKKMHKKRMTYRRR
jgi:hypothetical protein